jgi:uncharacterized membrane protein YfcA
MILSAIWTTITGDTFFPALVGAGFSTYLRSQKKETNVDLADLAAGGVASIAIGVLAGPYVASQLPDGQGVVGVGALIASFVAVSFFSQLHAMKWDIGAVIQSVVAAFQKKGGP